MSFNNYNNYGQNPFLNRPYTPPTYQSMPFNQPMVQQLQQNMPPANPSDMPITTIKYVDEKQIDGYIADPNTKVMLIDRNNKICGFKWCDSMGNCGGSKYRFEEFTETPYEVKNPHLDTSNFLTKQDVGDYVKKDELKTIFDKLSAIEKRIKINELLAEDENAKK